MRFGIHISKIVRFTSLIAAVCMLFSCVTSAQALPDFGEDEVKTPIGVDIHDMKARGLFGGEYTGDMFGDYELTIFVLWVVWSGASDTVMNVLEANKSQYISQGINVVGMYFEDDIHPITTGISYYDEHNYSIFSLINTYSENLDELFSKTYAYLPVIYLVNRNGIVLDYTSGYMTNYRMNRFVKKYKSDMNIVTFLDGTDGSVIYETMVQNGGFTYYPNVPVHDDYVFRCWDKTIENITCDMEVTALYERLGDVNFDGLVNSGDAALIMKNCVGIISFTDFTNRVGDVNRSGTVNTGDALLVLKIATGDV